VRWRRKQRSGDVVDRRGSPGRAAGIGAGLGIPGLVLAVFLLFFNGGGSSFDSVDDVLGGLEAPDGGGAGLPPGADPDARLVDFMEFVLDDVQGFWADTFAQAGRPYDRAKLVLFTNSTQSACGGATSSIGPHYCPPDKNVYLDLDFFQELSRRFGAPGDFAQAYVLAHEIGHHVQNELGINERVRNLENADPDAANELSVRLELQADCFAGVWAFTAYERNLLESGDVQEGLDAAAAVGDDRIQAQATGRIDAESWTHGSSDQRARWFSTGFQNGDPNDCGTFSAETL
jgi:uncharacterized protein